jgi:hypothetical protein
MCRQSHVRFTPKANIGTGLELDCEMSALGQKQTLQGVNPMSALPATADIGTQSWNVRFVPKADMGGLSHSDQASPLASRGDLHAKGNNCKHRPTAMKKNSRSYHQAAGNRANGGALQNISEGS